MAPGDSKTATGSNTEYVAAELTDAGLHEVMQHTVRYEGDKFEVGFEKTLSTINGPTASDLHYVNYFTDDISFSTTLTQTSGLDVEVYGMSSTGEDFYNVPIIQDPTDDDPCDFEAGGIYTYTTTLPDLVSYFLAYVDVGSNDLDLFVYYDADDSGTFTCPGERIASSTNSSGEDDYVELSFPAAGNYLITVQGGMYREVQVLLTGTGNAPIWITLSPSAMPIWSSAPLTRQPSSCIMWLR
jgi:hypothetical protein